MDSDDEWFYDSIKRYDHLLEYDLQGMLTSAVFKTPEKLIVSASRGEYNEIFELGLPHKIFGSENSSLSKDRDFKISAACYAKNYVSQIDILSGQNIISSETDGIHLYTFPKDETTDLIKHSEHLYVSTCPHFYVDNNRIFWTVDGKIVYSSDITTKQTDELSIKSNEDFSGVSTLKYNNEIYICSKNGCVVSMDMKSNTMIYQSNVKSISDSWTMDITNTGDYIILGSAHGDLEIHDKRKFNYTLFQTKINSDSNTTSEIVTSSLNNSFSYLCGKTLHIFDISLMDKIKNIFIHDGHRDKLSRKISTHLWHPTKEKFLFSCDDTFHFQAWKFRNL